MLDQILSRNNIFADDVEYYSEGWSNIIYHGRSHGSCMHDIVIKKIKDYIPEFDRKEIYDFLLQAMDNESMALKSLNHDNIPKLISDFIFDDQRYLVMEKKPGITLYNFIKSCEIDWPLVKYFFTKIINIFCHIHSRGIVHGDINPNNILVEKTKDGEANVHIIDFGASRHVSNPPVWNFPLGRHTFMAPEILDERKCVPPYKSFGFGADIHQMACLIFFMINKKNPFRRPYSHEQYFNDYLDEIAQYMRENIDKKILYFYNSKVMPGDFLDIYKKMLHPKPLHRYLNVMDLKYDFDQI